MESPTTLRLLPWPSPEGKPCYLATDEKGGYLSRLADRTEAEQIEIGTEVLTHAREALRDPLSPRSEIHYAAIRLAECLTDALRVAESRGLRLPSPDPEGPEDQQVTGERKPGHEPPPRVR
ncbi:MULTISPECIES: hypothetical protein [Streptomyces]|uniref:DUF1876 domain-containing protein n=1 Tax=Streptomyces virginiae TaxID=1961 RepID=A0ABZ1TGR2_STRVG|nr:hypothetical protein [Streptomyces virginiae]